MLTNSIQKARAFIEFQLQKFNAYLENEKTREIHQAENNETSCILFLLVVVWIIALEFGKHP